MTSIAENLKEVMRNMAAATEKCGRAKDDVQLVAVTKTYGVDVINEAIDLGVTDIGENRVQEILEKYDHVKPVRWHLIGHLQRNKVKYIIDKVQLIHSVESYDLAKEIDRQAKKHGKVQEILLEVNVSGEESKFGLVPDACADLCQRISADLENVRIMGLMTVAPYTDDQKLLRDVFEGLSSLAEEIEKMNIENVCMKELSMGMTNDYPLAIECGATMVRVGSGIFGNRDYTNA